MKFIISILLIVLLSFAFSLYLPWWSIAIAAFLVAVFIHLSPLKSFLAGFIAILLFWTVFAHIISSNNDHILAHRISTLILKMDNPFLLAVVSGLIGALVAGFASLTGSFVRSMKSVQ